MKYSVWSIFAAFASIAAAEPLDTQQQLETTTATTNSNSDESNGIMNHNNANAAKELILLIEEERFLQEAPMNMTEIFIERCYETLEEHDLDGDGTINRTEYVKVFFDLLGVPVPPGFQYAMLPLELVSAFNSAACAQCDGLPPSQYSSCCGANSAIDITDPEIVETLCDKFRTRLGAYRPSEFPSLMPSPSPSMVPSIIPSDEPSDVPSIIPSDEPSDVPSSSPSDVPSLLPSAKPSNVPTLSGSQHPSVTKSAVPTGTASDVPTELPSVKPSNAPVGSPSATPSSQPSCSQTAEAIVIEVQYPLTTNPGVNAAAILSASDGNTVLVDLISATGAIVNSTIAAALEGDEGASVMIGLGRRMVQNYGLKQRQMLDPTQVVSARTFAYEPYYDSAVPPTIDAVEDVTCDVDDLQYASSSDVSCTVVTSSITVFGYCDTDEEALKASIMTGLVMNFAGNMFCDFIEV